MMITENTTIITNNITNITNNITTITHEISNHIISNSVSSTHIDPNLFNYFLFSSIGLAILLSIIIIYFVENS